MSLDWPLIIEAGEEASIETGLVKADVTDAEIVRTFTSQADNRDSWKSCLLNFCWIRQLKAKSRERGYRALEPKDRELGKEPNHILLFGSTWTKAFHNMTSLGAGQYRFMNQFYDYHQHKQRHTISVFTTHFQLGFWRCEKIRLSVIKFLTVLPRQIEVAWPRKQIAWNDCTMRI